MIEAQAVLAGLKDTNDPTTINTAFLDVALTTDEDVPEAALPKRATIITQLTKLSATTLDVYAVHDEHVWCAQGTLFITPHNPGLMIMQSMAQAYLLTDTPALRMRC